MRMVTLSDAYSKEEVKSIFLNYSEKKRRSFPRFLHPCFLLVHKTGESLVHTISCKHDIIDEQKTTTQTVV